jgi:6-pyruvoyl-tetrahydropterin synthase
MDSTVKTPHSDTRPKFKYKITGIDFVNSVVTIKFWCEGMTSYNGFVENMSFSINTIQDMTEKEFDLQVYNYVKDNFEKLLIIHENYKSGKYDVLEKVARTERSLDVM